MFIAPGRSKKIRIKVTRVGTSTVYNPSSPLTENLNEPDIFISSVFCIES